MTKYAIIVDTVDRAINDAHHGSIEAISHVMRETVQAQADADAKIETVLQLHQLQCTINRKVVTMMRQLYSAPH